MKLDYTIVKSIVYGAEEILEENKGFSFLRFTKREIELYRERSGEINANALSTANIRVSFITDSETIKMSCTLSQGSGRCYGYFDLYENDVLIYHDGTDNVNENSVSFEVSLMKGKKHIEIYFPWSLAVKNFNLEIDEDSYIESVPRKGKMICYGDSITQGFDAEFPSLSYANQISKMLNRDSINKAIGGSIFQPKLLDENKNADADIVTVAYGTNDWFRCEYDEFKQNCRRFMDKLTDLYQKARVYVITPIWRAEDNSLAKMGISHSAVGSVIEEICKDYSNIKVINGRKLTPHESSFYWDYRLHPNDMGFLLYSHNLYNCLKE